MMNQSFELLLADLSGVGSYGDAQELLGRPETLRQLAYACGAPHEACAAWHEQRNFTKVLDGLVWLLPFSYPLVVHLVDKFPQSSPGNTVESLQWRNEQLLNSWKLSLERMQSVGMVKASAVADLDRQIQDLNQQIGQISGEEIESKRQLERLSGEQADLNHQLTLLNNSIAECASEHKRQIEQIRLIEKKIEKAQQDKKQLDSDFVADRNQLKVLVEHCEYELADLKTLQGNQQAQELIGVLENALEKAEKLTDTPVIYD